MIIAFPKIHGAEGWFCEYHICVGWGVMQQGIMMGDFGRQSTRIFPEQHFELSTCA